MYGLPLRKEFIYSLRHMHAYIYQVSVLLQSQVIQQAEQGM